MSLQIIIKSEANLKSKKKKNFRFDAFIKPIFILHKQKCSQAFTQRDALMFTHNKRQTA